VLTLTDVLPPSNFPAAGHAKKTTWLGARGRASLAVRGRGASSYANTRSPDLTMAYLDAYAKLVNDVKQSSPMPSQQRLAIRVHVQAGKLYEQANLKSKVVRDLDPGMTLYPTAIKKHLVEVTDELATKVGAVQPVSWPGSRAPHFPQQCRAVRSWSDEDLSQWRAGAAGVDLDVEQGDFFACWDERRGKTTLIGIITSLVNKSAGTQRVRYDLDTQLEARNPASEWSEELNFNQFETIHDLVNQRASMASAAEARVRPRSTCASCSCGQAQRHRRGLSVA